MKRIVTHLKPDLDAVAACWLIHKYLPGWKEASIEFVAAGSKTEDVVHPDENDEIIHVDTGGGKFDHHDSNEDTCAAMLVYQDLMKKNLIHPYHKKALERLLQYVNDTDHFRESHYHQAQDDIYDMCLHQIVVGLNHTLSDSMQVITHTIAILEAELQLLRNKVRAEEEIQKGIEFQSKWGRSLALTSRNEEAMKLAMKMGYELVLRKDPERGGVRIKTLPSNTSNLNELYELLKTKDENASWFMHQSGNVLLNSSSINPALVPTTLSLNDVIEIIKSVR